MVFQGWLHADWRPRFKASHLSYTSRLNVQCQNSNNSVRIPHAFFEALNEGRDWELKARTDGRVMKSIPAQEIWDMIADAAWVTNFKEAH